MSKQSEYPPSNYDAPPQQPPPAYGAPPSQPGYPITGIPPQPGYPMPQQYVTYNPGMGHQPQVYQYGNVVVQQPAYAGVPIGPPPPDHMTAAILATLFCFWPTGIIAIMRTSDARAAVARGDVASASTLARSAKNMINLSVCFGIITIIVFAVIIGVYFGFIVKRLYDIDDDYND